MNKNINVYPKWMKFDPKTFQSFEKILVRDYNSDVWKCDFFSHYDAFRTFPYVCVGGVWEQLISYNDETKHLVGTTDACPEYYKWWEE